MARQLELAAESSSWHASEMIAHLLCFLGLHRYKTHGTYPDRPGAFLEKCAGCSAKRVNELV